MGNIVKIRKIPSMVENSLSFLNNIIYQFPVPRIFRVNIDKVNNSEIRSD